LAGVQGSAVSRHAARVVACLKGQIDGATTPHNLLSQRELEILKLIEQGHSNKEIAARCVIAIGTVKRHTVNIFNKLGVDSRTQAIARARELDLI